MKHNFLQNSINKYARIYAAVGCALIITLVVIVILAPLNIAPEFTGSADLRLRFDADEQVVVSESVFEDFPYEVVHREISATEHSFTSRSLSDEEYQSMLDHIHDSIGSYTVVQYESSSPSISQELVRKAIIALVMAMFIIICYIAFVFRGVSRPVASWKYGIVAVVALLHDIILPFGIFIILGQYTTATIDTLFVTALLATLGYSINDTIVVFDRIRDYLKVSIRKKDGKDFGVIVGQGVQNSMRRSVYTSLSTIVPLTFLFLLVPITRWFGVALFIGVIAGTYSSLFFAPSVLLLWHRYFPQKEGTQRQKTETEKAEESLRDMLHKAGDTI